jgi:RNA polymerase sigma-70 factor, ECF subfamily
MADELVTRRFAAACGSGDVAALEAILAVDAVVVCDGGGTMRSAVEPVEGAEPGAGLVAGLLAGRTGAVLSTEPVNGRIGLVLRRAGRALAVTSLEVAGSEVTAVWIVLDPAKLARWHLR